MKKWNDALKNASAWIALTTILCGVVVILGWIFDIPALKSVFPDLVTMKFNTAICFCLTGASLYIAQMNRTDARLDRSRIISSSISGLIGVLTIFEYLAGINLGIDQLFVEELSGAIDTTHLGRMAITTALSFVTLNGALILFKSQAKFSLYIM